MMFKDLKFYGNKLFFLLLFIILASSAIAQTNTGDRRVLFTVQGKPVFEDEFKYVYTKNNINNQADFSEKSLRDYLDLFVKFRLKVAQAEELKLDTVESLKSELSSYRKQLAKSYLNDKDVYQRLEKEAYERLKEEVKVSHLLVRLDPDAAPADTLIAYKKIINYRKSILKTKDFASIAYQYSEDPSAKVNKGNLGYITAFQTVYPFENAVYSTPVGEVSLPFRTKFGYHIIQVEAKRPARGQINVAQIAVARADQSKVFYNADSAAKSKIFSILSDIKSNKITFEQAVSDYSDDKKTKSKNGEMGFFSTGKMAENFEDAAFALKDKGQLSEPISTSVGWHILKLIEKKPVGTFNEMKTELKTKIDRDSRSDLSRISLINKIKEKYGWTENTNLKNELIAKVDSSILKGAFLPFTDTIKGMNSQLFKIGDSASTGKDFYSFMVKNQRTKKKFNTAAALSEDLYEDFIELRCLEYYEKFLEVEFPEFRFLMKEYRDGILLFDLTDRMVWSKASKDTSGLKSFYETVKTKYLWGNRIDVDIYNCTDLSIANSTRKLLEKGKPSEEITKSLNAITSNSRVSVISGKYEKNQYELLNKIDWTTGLKNNIINPDSSVTIINVKRLVGPEPKLLNEVKGFVISDYQDFLEKQWIDELKSKFPIVVNEEVLKSLIKK